MGLSSCHCSSFLFCTHGQSLSLGMLKKNNLHLNIRDCLKCWCQLGYCKEGGGGGGNDDDDENEEEDEDEDGVE